MSKSREEQRQMILDSQEIRSGDPITGWMASHILKVQKELAQKLLREMKRDGDLVSYTVDGKRGASGKQIIFYKRPPPRLARMSWRRRTNERLNIEAMGVCGR
jgi:hypothetical protein